MIFTAVSKAPLSMLYSLSGAKMTEGRSTYEVTATRKRPQDFDFLVGQDFVVSTLENAISENRIAHAYLFSGPRGVGKTSSARLLAKALNCQRGMSAHPCGVCDSCVEIAKGKSVDVIEIDGASNTSVNDIRNIKEEIMFPPQSSRYKIYIIDEVHMLSTSAFNALLKTIEEPPEYIIFIFATTELQKVPATIRSRCQQFRFSLISEELIMKCLRSAAEDIHMEADEDALFWIAKEATGSMRDAYTLFDQVASFSGDHITLDKIRQKLSIAGFSAIASIVAKTLSGETGKALEEIGGLFEDGISPEQIVKDSAEFFRTLLLYKEGIRRTDVLGSAIKDIPEDIVNALTREQLEAALKSFLTLYRELRYSLSPRFEIELLYSRLSSLPLLATPDVLMKKLEDLKNGVAEGSVVIRHKAKAAPVQIQAARTEATAPPQPAYEAEPAEEEEEASEEEEEPGQRGPLSLDDIPAIAESLLKMGKRAESRYVSYIEAIEENDDGTFSLLLSKPLAFNSLKNAEKDLQKAIASATGEGYMIRLRLKEQRDHADEGFSPEMRKLKAFFGGQLVRKEGAVTEEDREDEYITFRNDEEDQLS